MSIPFGEIQEEDSEISYSINSRNTSAHNRSPYSTKKTKQHNEITIEDIYRRLEQKPYLLALENLSQLQYC